MQDSNENLQFFDFQRQIAALGQAKAGRKPSWAGGSDGRGERNARGGGRAPSDDLGLEEELFG
jgi:hypothetical protein